jgi:hypothetical protein
MGSNHTQFELIFLRIIRRNVELSLHCRELEIVSILMESRKHRVIMNFYIHQLVRRIVVFNCVLYDTFLLLSVLWRKPMVLYRLLRCVFYMLVEIHVLGELLS